jgi:hypothetical protein
MCLLAISLLALTARAQNFTFSTFDVPGADSTDLNGINRHMIGPIRSQSTIVGSYRDIGGTHAFSLGPGGLTTLPEPPNSAAAGQCAYCRDTEARGISNAGVIVGTYATDVPDTTLPFRFFSGILTDPGSECGYNTEALGVNDQGAIVGACQTAEIWNGVQGTGLGLYTSASLRLAIGPGFIDPRARYTVISSVNDSGLTVGWFTENLPPWQDLGHGFYMSVGSGFPHTVVDVPNASGTWLTGVNNRNQIVGYYYEGRRYHGFFWPHGAASPITLDYPGAVNTHVMGISDPNPLTGQFEVVGYYDDEVVNNGWVHHGFVAVTTLVATQP